MEDFGLEQWHDFGVATAGAAGALVGLLIVAISVNIREILRSKLLPARAGATIAALSAVLIGALLLLVPGQSRNWLGMELVVVSFVALVFQVRMVVVLGRDHDPAAPTGSRSLKSAVAVGQLVPVLVGGILVVAGQPSVGLAWVAAGFLAVFVFSITNAWVLMVEILR